MSIQAKRLVLRARLEDLSSEILLQKELLKKLEHDKVLAKRELNAVMDPVALLPLEISSEIFLQSLDPLPKPQPRARHAPMLLLNICNAWSAIALSTPALWSSIRIDFPCRERLTQLLPIWFQRARNHPLSISLHGDLGRHARYRPLSRDLDGDSNAVDHRVRAMIWQQGDRLKHLQISDDYELEDSEVEMTSEAAFTDDGSDLIELFGTGKTPGPLPLLETLRIRGSIGGRRFRGPQILQLLRLAPNIVECNFDYKPLLEKLPVASEKLVLPTLRRLTFGNSETQPGGNLEMLTLLTLPALEVLAVPVRGFGKAFRRFLKRSAAPIQTLVIGPRSGVRSSTLRECMLLLPSLASLQICCNSHTADAVYSALVDSPSLLPNLRHLKIYVLTKHPISSASWRALVSVVSTRRVEFHVRLVRSLPQDVFAAFRALVVDGVRISIGTGWGDFMSGSDDPRIVSVGAENEEPRVKLQRTKM
ncbi:hypothetical protein B0H14DRAFT_2678872 [Mycena olivaceomarginata]|nr:hypothetical protein B0H14DRAFT_2678872 [Mycena olivaceomarginata]